LVVMSISFCSELHCSPQDLHSFPTRRSSDLIIVREGEGERPSSAARIFARYRGTNLERERFDASNIAISLNLLGDGTQIDGNSGVVRGFRELAMLLNASTGFEVNPDNSINWNDDYGMGIVIMPS